MAPLFLALRVRLDVVDGLANARDLLGVLVGNFDPELLLEGHDELDGVERVGAEIVHERRIRRHFFFIDAELFHDDAFDFVCNRHVLPPTYIYIPPLTARTWPVIYDAASEARKHTADATSSGDPRRPSGIFEAQVSCALAAIARVISVSIRPGATTFTVMPREATSCASALQNPMMPAF